MEIKLKLGRGIDKIVETAELTDQHADVLEALQKLYEVCERYQLAGMARIMYSPEKYSGMYNYPKKRKEAEPQVLALMEGVAEWVAEASAGHLRIVEVDK